IDHGNFLARGHGVSARFLRLPESLSCVVATASVGGDALYGSALHGLRLLGTGRRANQAWAHRGGGAVLYRTGACRDTKRPLAERIHVTGPDSRGRPDRARDDRR